MIRTYSQVGEGERQANEEKIFFHCTCFYAFCILKEAGYLVLKSGLSSWFLVPPTGPNKNYRQLPPGLLKKDSAQARGRKTKQASEEEKDKILCNLLGEESEATLMASGTMRRVTGVSLRLRTDHRHICGSAH